MDPALKHSKACRGEGRSELEHAELIIPMIHLKSDTTKRSIGDENESEQACIRSCAASVLLQFLLQALFPVKHKFVLEEPSVAHTDQKNSFKLAGLAVSLQVPLKLTNDREQIMPAAPLYNLQMLQHINVSLLVYDTHKHKRFQSLQIISCPQGTLPKMPSSITVMRRPAAAPTKPNKPTKATKAIAQPEPNFGPSSFPSLPQAQGASKQGTEGPPKPLSMPLSGTKRRKAAPAELDLEQPKLEQPKLVQPPEKKSKAKSRRHRCHQALNIPQARRRGPVKSFTMPEPEPTSPWPHFMKHPEFVMRGEDFPALPTKPSVKAPSGLLEREQPKLNESLFPL